MADSQELSTLQWAGGIIVTVMVTVFSAITASTHKTIKDNKDEANKERDELWTSLKETQRGLEAARVLLAESAGRMITREELRSELDRLVKQLRPFPPTHKE